MSWAALRLRWGRGEEEDSYPWAALPGTRERPGEQLGGRHKWTVNITTCTTRTVPAPSDMSAQKKIMAQDGGGLTPYPAPLALPPPG